MTVVVSQSNSNLCINNIMESSDENLSELISKHLFYAIPTPDIRRHSSDHRGWDEGVVL